MAYLYRKNRSPFWYIQYVDSDRRKHDKSTGVRADDPNTVKAKILRAELEAKEYQRVPVVNGAAWDTWVPKFLARHCETRKTFVRYENAWRWIALWLQRQRIHTPRQLSPHQLRSASKSFISTLVGITVDQGKIRGEDQPIVELLPWPVDSIKNPDGGNYNSPADTPPNEIMGNVILPQLSGE